MWDQLWEKSSGTVWTDTMNVWSSFKPDGDRQKSSQTERAREWDDGQTARDGPTIESHTGRTGQTQRYTKLLDSNLWMKTAQTHLQTVGQRRSERQSCLNSVKDRDNQRQTQANIVRDRDDQRQPKRGSRNSWTDKDGIVPAETSMSGCGGRRSGLWTSCDAPSLSWTPQGSWERHWATFPTSGPGLGTLKGTDTHDQIFLFLTETSALAQLDWLDLDIYNLLLSD